LAAHLPDIVDFQKAALNNRGGFFWGSATGSIPNVRDATSRPIREPNLLGKFFTAQTNSAFFSAGKASFFMMLAR